MVTYILFLEVKKNIKIKIGSLGKIKFERGIYAYVGSAKRNFKSRISRHFSKKKKLHWHVDYLTTNEFVDPYAVYIIEKDEESKLANFLMRYWKPVPRFGSSDTHDLSHLFKIESFIN